MADSTTPPAGSDGSGSDNSNAGNGGNSGSGSNAKPASVTKQIAEIQDQMADNPRPDKDEPVEIQREWKTLINGLSKKAAALRKQQIANDPNLSDEEKDVLKLYDKGVHIYGIAVQVYKFANYQTVGLVTNIIRKAHADDFADEETVNSTKGYTGIGAGTGLPQV